ncbi:sequence-specific DNA binding RNA polymerase II transcription factor [Ascochyta rabiei]|uniref:Sequence-specific DNA binding RNA polymerase II transcription factor n=1 Tax=Didymella rabiei TaxID=5454 RepID=A0A162XEC3_DIDRA|nr:sequence-specific DNA binding RNA polymerase II transcription factor [Ascochyta rabiei]
MSNWKLQIEESRETRVVDEHEWISSWLRDADYEERNQNVNDAGDIGAVEPVTPQRRPLQILNYDEVSPTNTNFSHDSVFDTPQGFGDSWTEEDPFCDDVPDVTSVLDFKAEVVQDSRETPQEDFANDFEVRSFASYDPPSDIDEGLAKSINAKSINATSINATSKAHIDTVALPTEQNGIRITWITSLLLKLQGEDESHWVEKLRLACEFDTLWHDHEDRKNWVLPPVDGRRGDFRAHGVRVPRTHPGEGKGHLTYRELEVAIGN